MVISLVYLVIDYKMKEIKVGLIEVINFKTKVVNSSMLKDVNKVTNVFILDTINKDLSVSKVNFSWF